MKKCQKCNTELEKEAIFCVVCGEKITSVDQDTISKYKDWSYLTLLFLPVNVIILFVLDVLFKQHSNHSVFYRQELISAFLAYSLLVLIPVLFTIVVWFLFYIFKKKLELPIKGSVVGSILFTIILALGIIYT